MPQSSGLSRNGDSSVGENTLSQKEHMKKIPNTISDGKWALYLELRSSLLPHPEDRRIPLDKRPCVSERIEGAYLMGVTREEVEIIEAFPPKNEEREPSDFGAVRTEYVWVVSDKPFVALLNMNKLTTGLTPFLRVAQQVHFGKLGRKPQLTEKVEVAQSNIKDPEDFGSYFDEEKGEWRDREVRKLNWVRLIDVAETTGLSCEEILRGFSKFSASTYYEPNVPVIAAEKAVDLMGKEYWDFNRYRFYTETLPESFCGGELGWGGYVIDPTGHVIGGFDSDPLSKPATLWITQSLGLIVGRLAMFGYRPDNETPTPGFKLEAKMPDASAAEFPVLPVEKLKELHELRQELPNELSNKAFRRAAQIALGSSEYFDGGGWTSDPDLDDKSNGFSYYVNFEKITAFKGRLTVGVCYWTRAGADKTDNYWAGFISVMPEPETNGDEKKPKAKPDPRRDKNALLRIWFWPDNLVRVLPAGSAGGLCPPEINPEIADLVKSFLDGLCYTV